MSTPATDQYFPGLEGVIACETSICSLEGRGEGGLAFRGYSIEDLAESVSYMEAAYLLLHGELPNSGQLISFESRIKSARPVPEALIQLLHAIPPSVHPMDVLRTSVSVLAHYDPDNGAVSTDHAANVRKAERLIAQMATAVAYRERIERNQPLVPPRDDLDHAANFLNMINGGEPVLLLRELARLGGRCVQVECGAVPPVDLIDWPEGFHRTDIGWRALG